MYINGHADFTWGGCDVSDFPDVISFPTNIPYNLDHAVILYFTRSYPYYFSQAYHLQLTGLYLRVHSKAINKGRLQPNIGIDAYLLVGGELLYKSLSKIKEIKRSKHAESGAEWRERGTSLFTTWNGVNSRTPAQSAKVE